MSTPKSPKHPKVTLPRGRVYLCVGPNCWGKGFTAVDAEKAAKENHSRGPWKFLMYDAPPDAFVDDMGRIVYTPSLYFQPETAAPDTGPTDDAPIGYAAVEVYRFNAPAPEKPTTSYRRV